MFSKVKYVTAGWGSDGPRMYVIIQNKTEHGYWKVEVFPCDDRGTPVSDAVAWDIFPSWWDSYKYLNKQYKKFNQFVNHK